MYEYELVGLSIVSILTLSYKIYSSIALSLAPGVHDNTTVPEQVRELKVAVREVGGDGGSREGLFEICITSETSWVK